MRSGLQSCRDNYSPDTSELGTPPSFGVGRLSTSFGAEGSGRCTEGSIRVSVDQEDKTETTDEQEPGADRRWETTTDEDDDDMEGGETTCDEDDDDDVGGGEMTCDETETTCDESENNGESTYYGQCSSSRRTRRKDDRTTRPRGARNLRPRYLIRPRIYVKRI